MERRIITTEATEEDKKIETSLRPQFLAEYIGQEKIKETLKVYIDAAKSRGGGPGPCSVLWAARSWKDDSGRNYCQRDGD